MSARILVHGALGRMGTCVRAAVAASSDAELGAAIEGSGHPQLGAALEEGVVLGDDLGAGLSGCEAAISFATPAASLQLVRAADELGIPCALGTTGFDPQERAELSALAGKLPLVWTANFSVSVNVLFHLARQAAGILGEDFDAEIVELHHSAKVDAPSGTALRLGAAVAEGRAQDFDAQKVLTREGHTGARLPGRIGIQTLRGGDAPGDHTLLLIGRGERLELSHRSMTRDHFAEGALRAALWAIGRAPALYDMEQVLNLR